MKKIEEYSDTEIADELKRRLKTASDAFMKWKFGSLSVDPRLVILIPGHAQDTPGKRSPLGFCAPNGVCAFREYEFNWDHALRVQEKLDALNIPNTILPGIDMYKDVPVQKRATLVNELVKQYPKSFVLEIHANAFSDPRANGMEAWTSKGETLSDELASIWYEEAKILPFRARMDQSDGDADKEGLLYMPRKTDCPHLLIEYGFYTNVNDLQYLQSYDGRDTMAAVTASTAVEFSKKYWK